MPGPKFTHLMIALCPPPPFSLMPLDSEGLISKATIENVKRLGNALQGGSGFSGI